MKIYTKTGDGGDTGLIGGRRVRKCDPAVSAYGEVDELNCAVGAALPLLPGGSKTLAEALGRVQQELFVVGAILAGQKASIPEASVTRLEGEIDRMTADLPELRRFILPGGCPGGAALHLARAVCRRAERAVVSLEKPPEDVVRYLNRLSDHLFTSARWANKAADAVETPWQGL